MEQFNFHNDKILSLMFSIQGMAAPISMFLYFVLFSILYTSGLEENKDNEKLELIRQLSLSTIVLYTVTNFLYLSGVNQYVVSLLSVINTCLIVTVLALVIRDRYEKIYSDITIISSYGYLYGFIIYMICVVGVAIGIFRNANQQLPHLYQ